MIDNERCVEVFAAVYDFAAQEIDGNVEQEGHDIRIDKGQYSIWVRNCRSTEGTFPKRFRKIVEAFCQKHNLANDVEFA